MSFNVCPLNIKWGSNVVPSSQLNGIINPKGSLQVSSNYYFKEGLQLYKLGKIQAAKRKFLKMFHCTKFEVRDFEEVGILFSKTSSKIKSIRASSFSKQFLKQAKELNSEKPEVYIGLASLYYEQAQISKADEMAKKLAEVSPNTKETIYIRTKIYQHQLHRGSKESILLGFKLINNKETKKIGEELVLKGILEYEAIIQKKMYLGMIDVRVPKLTCNYYKIHEDIRLEIANMYFEKIKHYAEKLYKKNVLKISSEQMYKLIEYTDIKNSIVALALMANKKNDKNHKVYMNHLNILGLDKQKVIEKDVERVQLLRKMNTRKKGFFLP